MSTKTWLITLSTNAQTATNQEYTQFDHILHFTKNDLQQDTLFWLQHEGNATKWRSFLIRKTLAQMSDGDVLFFLVDLSWNDSQFRLLLDELKNINQQCKRDIRPLHEIDALVFQACWKVRAFVDDWYFSDGHFTVYGLHIFAASFNAGILAECPPLFDVVVPLGPTASDLKIININLELIRKNICGFRSIFVITNLIYASLIPNAYIYSLDTEIQAGEIYVVDETIFPFKIEDAAKINSVRAGWLFQQLLKMYASFVIAEMLDIYLVIDTDTLFLKPTTFLESAPHGPFPPETPPVFLFNYGTENNEAYFKQMKKLHPTFQRMIPDKSGICHHMIFYKPFLKEMMNMVGLPFWEKVLSAVDPNDFSGLSEYEMYFNFMLQYYPENIRLRHLSNMGWHTVDHLDEIKQTGMQYINLHHYILPP